MIKRLYYNLEHGDRDDPSDPSSSSSGSAAEAADATEESEEDEVSEVNGNDESGSIPSGHDNDDDSRNDGNSSGHDSEDDSGNDGNSTGLPLGEDIETGRENPANLWSSGNQDSKFRLREPILIEEEKLTFISNKEKESSIIDIKSCILKCKSVFRCRICPTVVCLNDDTLNAHLKSKRHARSEKLLKEGKLKAMLNSVGQIEDEEENEEPTTAKENWEGKPDGHKKQKRVGKKKRHMGKRIRGPTRGLANKRRRN